MAKGKVVNFTFIREDTPAYVNKAAGGYGIYFDFEPNSKKQMTGFIITDAEVAENLAKHIQAIAKLLRKKKP